MKQAIPTMILNGSAQPTRGGAAAVTALPSPEVTPKAKRRSFSVAYKRRIVITADKCSQKGEIGALLRREGLYSSQLAIWRKQMATGELSTEEGKKRGRKPQQTVAEKENARLQREVARMEKKLAQAELIIAAQKKVSELLELMNQQHVEQS